MSQAFAYEDILHSARPVHRGDAFSRRHPPMPRPNRAKLFAPFAALSGFEGRIRRKEVAYEPRRALSEGERERLNRQLNRLKSHEKQTVVAEYFERCADPEHEAFGRLGTYRRLEGRLHWLDPVARTLRLNDTVIPFEDLYRLREVG